MESWSPRYEAPGLSAACGRSYACRRSTMTSEAQRSRVGATGYFEARVAVRIVSLSCFFCIVRPGVSSCGAQGHAFVGIEAHEDRLADRRAQRRVPAREERALAQLHLEIDALAEEDLLVHLALAHVGALGPGLGQVHVLRTHREEHLLVGAERL